MIEHEPSHEYPALLALEYPEAWQELRQSIDPQIQEQQRAVDTLAALTHKLCVTLAWTQDSTLVRNRWQRAIELAAELMIDREYMRSDAEYVGAGIEACLAVVGQDDWIERGLSFRVPNLWTNSEATLDLRDLSDHIAHE